MKKRVTVQYTNDPVTDDLTARVLSSYFNLTAVVTQAKDFNQLKERAENAVDLVMEIAGYKERYKDLDVAYERLSPADFARRP